MNARSLRNKLDDIQTLTTLVNYVDIVAITESWLYPQETNLFNLPNYSAHHSLRLVNNNDPSRGGGVVLFVKEGMNAIVINNIQNKFNILLVKISKRSVSIHVILCYSPNFNTYFDLIQKLSLLIVSRVKMLCWATLTLICYMMMPYLLSTKCFFVSRGLNPLYDGIPNRVTDHSSSLIDHVFSNIRNECCHVGMFMRMVSITELYCFIIRERVLAIQF